MRPLTANEMNDRRAAERQALRNAPYHEPQSLVVVADIIGDIARDNTRITIQEMGFKGDPDTHPEWTGLYQSFVDTVLDELQLEDPSDGDITGYFVRRDESGNSSYQRPLTSAERTAVRGQVYGMPQPVQKKSKARPAKLSKEGLRSWQKMADVIDTVARDNARISVREIGFKGDPAAHADYRYFYLSTVEDILTDLESDPRRRNYAQFSGLVRVHGEVGGEPPPLTDQEGKQLRAMIEKMASKQKT